jgi:uncharacterized coiled-coil protein SlyX
MEDQFIKDELSQMDARLTEMEEKITSIDTKLTQVVDAILGNPLTRRGGFIDNMKSMEQRLENVEKKQVAFEDFKKKLLWTLGIVVSLGLLLEYLTKIYVTLK